MAKSHRANTAMLLLPQILFPHSILLVLIPPSTICPFHGSRDGQIARAWHSNWARKRNMNLMPSRIQFTDSAVMLEPPTYSEPCCVRPCHFVFSMKVSTLSIWKTLLWAKMSVLLSIIIQFFGCWNVMSHNLPLSRTIFVEKLVSRALAEWSSSFLPEFEILNLTWMGYHLQCCMQSYAFCTGIK